MIPGSCRCCRGVVWSDATSVAAVPIHFEGAADMVDFDSSCRLMMLAGQDRMEIFELATGRRVCAPGLNECVPAGSSRSASSWSGKFPLPTGTGVHSAVSVCRCIPLIAFLGLMRTRCRAVDQGRGTRRGATAGAVALSSDTGAELLGGLGG